VDTTDHDELDQVLRRLASPATQITPAVEDELASLTIATRRVARPVARKRAWRLSLTAGIPAVAVFGIGAAAMATGLWAPWAQTGSSQMRV
jgi:fatty acid desaturase